MLDNHGRKMQDPWYKFFDEEPVLNIENLKGDKKKSEATRRLEPVRLQSKAERVYDVKMYDAKGNLKRTVSGEVLKKKEPQYFEF